MKKGITKSKAKLTFKIRIIRWFTPQQQRFREALCFTGYPNNKRKPEPKNPPGLLKRIFRKIPQIILLGFFIYCLYENNLRLWLLTFLLLGLILVRNELLFVWWYLKVYVLFRRFYADRRYYYNQGTLYFQFSTQGGKSLKKPFKFNKGKMIIWAMNQKIATTVHKKHSGITGEYIKLL